MFSFRDSQTSTLIQLEDMISGHKITAVKAGLRIIFLFLVNMQNTTNSIYKREDKLKVKTKIPRKVSLSSSYRQPKTPSIHGYKGFGVLKMSFWRCTSTRCRSIVGSLGKHPTRGRLIGFEKNEVEKTRRT